MKDNENFNPSIHLSGKKNSTSLRLFFVVGAMLTLLSIYSMIEEKTATTISVLSSKIEVNQKTIDFLMKDHISLKKELNQNLKPEIERFMLIEKLAFVPQDSLIFIFSEEETIPPLVQNLGIP